YISPPGTSLAETDRLLRQVESVLQQTREVQTYSRRTGLQLGGGITEANTGDFFVRLKPFPRRGIEEIMNDVRDEIEKHIPGLQVELLQLMEDLIGDLTSVPQPIEIKLYSDDEQLLRTLPPRVAEACAGAVRDRKSTRLNSSHQIISYAVFCLKKKKLIRHGVNRARTVH